jgi:voltage-gated potassium channel
VLRTALIAAVLVVLYYLLPLDRPRDSDTAVRLLIGLLVVAGVVMWGVRIVAGSRYPGVRAAEAQALALPFFPLLFASTYFRDGTELRGQLHPAADPYRRLYFTVTVFTTVGFGDITAKSETARVVLIVQMLADLLFLGAGVRVLLGAVQRGRDRRSETGDNAGQATPSTPP